MNEQPQMLVTGATGFIGSHLAGRLAARGDRVRCLVRDSSPAVAREYLSGLGAELVEGDLTNPESLAPAVEGIATVFHLGGGGTTQMMSEEAFRRINVDATRNLLEACLGRGAVRRFVHMSTCGVMGDIRHPPADETAPYRPENVAYSRMKTEAEKVALSYRDRLPMVVVRMPGVYGPPVIKDEASRISGVSPLLLILSMVKRGRWRYIGDGRTLTHWVYIDDAVAGLLSAAERGRRGEVYIIAGERWLTMQEFVETAARILGVQAPSRHIPVPVARVAAAATELTGRLLRRAPALRREAVTAFLVNRAFDISKARQELGFEPTVGLEHGMRATVRWFEENRYL